jgi:cytochrome c oxidase cbb3-type subunit 3
VIYTYINFILQVNEPVISIPTSGFLAGLSPLEQLLVALVAIVLVAGFGAVINLSFTLMNMQRVRLLKELHPELLEEAAAELISPSIPWWKQLYDKLTDDVPMEEEVNILLDHNYDGVMELDNNLPPWWKGLFYGAIAFAPVYLYVNHWADFSVSSREAYAIEMEYAEEEVKAFLATQENAVDESNVELLADAGALEKGRIVFIAKCAVCHGKLGEGGIGPNLADEYWLHGGDVKNVFKSIKYGIPAKGMIAWKNELRPRDMQELASFIKTLAGTNPPNPKAPQGEPFTEAESK